MMNKYINYILVATSALVMTVLFYLSDDKTSIPIQTDVIQKKTLKEPIEIVYDESPNIKHEVKTIESREVKDENKSIKNIRISDLADIYNLQLKEETTTLYKSSDKNNRYTISLKSSQKITSVLPGGRYILLNGILEEAGVQSKFSLSFNEHYKDYTQYAYIEVTNKDTNTTASCDGSFLSGITPEYKYSLRCDISGDMLSCYIESEKEVEEILNIFDKENINKLRNKEKENRDANIKYPPNI